MDEPTAYPTLFSPLRIGPLTVANRVVFAAHLTNYAVDGLPTAQHAAYYAARAAGGAGLIITEEHTTDPADRPYEKLIRGYDPAAVPGYRRITGAVHAHGVPILAQLNHNGGQSSGRYTRQPVRGPSPVPDPLFGEVPEQLAVRDIAGLVAGYARVAASCVAGGFDGVEIQCSQSSLVRGFLSPATNRRTDGYGGPLVNRSRLLLQIIDAVRTEIGPEQVLGVRLSGDEGVVSGTTDDDAVETARLIDADGRVDYLNTSIGVATATLFRVEPSMRTPPGYSTPLVGSIRRAVGIPVVVVGRFTRPQEAERALVAGHADLVGIVRGQIADPEFAAKAHTGHAEHIRTCLGCNQDCVGRVGLNRPLGCVVNPLAGHEAVPVSPPRRRGRRVLVVGGGPGGLQAAVTAHQRGHRVTLLERRDRLGGQVPTAAAAPGRAGFGFLARDLIGEVRRLGVEIGMSCRATAALVVAGSPDAVILATGSRAARPRWAQRSDRIVDVRDVLEGRATPSGAVVVVDELGFHHATSTAELLADRGCAVEIITPGLVVGQDLGLTLDLELWNIAATARGIRQSTELAPLAAAEGPDGRVVVSLLHHPTGTEQHRVVDWVVCAVHAEPEDALWHDLRGVDFAVHRIGDCLTPRRADAAIREGHRVGLAL